ncbi:hypothetical protein JI752_007860 [Lysobacter sp. MMG2]|nr:hypothetical protein [Lysobacter sp. MMG2]
MRYTAPLLLAIAAALAAGCATSPTLDTQERLALYREHAGAPVPSFRLERMTGTQNWTPLGDQALAVWSSASRGHLLELVNRCPAMSSASGIAITNRGGQVTARVDAVMPRTATGLVAVGSGTCRIDSIRPLDGRSLRDAKRELREADMVERSDGG